MWHCFSKTRFLKSAAIFAALTPVVLQSACSLKKNRSVDSNQIHILQMETYTASDAGFAVNSHLISGEKEAILVDAQFTRSDAVNVVKMIKASGKKLTTIFITHGHPDHYFGLEAILTAFPSARVVARPRVAAEIRKSAKNYLKQWKPMYKNEMPEQIVYPKPQKSRLLMLDDQRIDIVDLHRSESSVASALYIPSLRTLVSGDLVYSGVHLWLADKRGSVSKWLDNLKTINSFGPIDIILPGHGEEGDGSLLAENAQYIEFFQSTIASGLSEDDSKRLIKEKYPAYRLPIIVDLSVAAQMKKPAPAKKVTVGKKRKK